jgi:hypothetical protein
MNYITRYAHIRDRSLLRQGEVVYSSVEGTFDQFLDNAFQSLAVGYPKFYKMDASAKLGLLATEMLLKGITLKEVYSPQNVALVLSNAHASLDTDLRYFESTKTMASPALFVYTLPNIVSGEICIRQGIKGENAFFVWPKFEADQLLQYVEMVMNSGNSEACIAGWIDVMGSQHDVFLYLTEKTKRENSVEHSAVQLKKLYQVKTYGTVNS